MLPLPHPQEIPIPSVGRVEYFLEKHCVFQMDYSIKGFSLEPATHWKFQLASSFALKFVAFEISPSPWNFPLPSPSEQFPLCDARAGNLRVDVYNFHCSPRFSEGTGHFRVTLYLCFKTSLCVMSLMVFCHPSLKSHEICLLKRVWALIAYYYNNGGREMRFFVTYEHRITKRI